MKFVCSIWILSMLYFWEVVSEIEGILWQNKLIIVCKIISYKQISHNSIETSRTMNRPIVLRMLMFSVQMDQYNKTTSPLIEKNLQNISFEKKMTGNYRAKL